MKNKISVFIMLICLILVSGCSKQNNGSDLLSTIKQRDKIIVGVKFDTKPFGFMDKNGKLQGFDIDLAKSIAKNILGDENKVEFKQVTTQNRILALNSGQVDMVIATMSITNHRKQIIDFSDPYYFAGQAILVPKASDISSISDLNGKRVIIVYGSTSEDSLRALAPDAQIMGFKTYTSAFKALKQGDADAMTSDDTILLGFAIADDTVKLLPQRYTREPYAIGFKKDTNAQNLEKRVNSTLSEMQSSGELRQLKYKWIKY